MRIVQNSLYLFRNVGVAAGIRYVFRNWEKVLQNA